MKKAAILLIFGFSTFALFAQNEIGPEGEKLIWVLLILALVPGLYFVFRKKGTPSKKQKKPLFQITRIQIELEKDALYYPDNLRLKIKNTGNSDVDIDQPLLIFDNFWLKRKFKIKGIGNRTFYPLYLEKGKTHTLDIELARFYMHDKSLKKYPKAKIVVFNVKGKRLGSRSVFLRKTLFKY